MDNRYFVEQTEHIYESQLRDLSDVKREISSVDKRKFRLIAEQREIENGIAETRRILNEIKGR